MSVTASWLMHNILSWPMAMTVYLSEACYKLANDCNSLLSYINYQLVNDCDNANENRPSIILDTMLPACQWL